jgi:hypothetical protein
MELISVVDGPVEAVHIQIPLPRLFLPQELVVLQ